MKTHTVCVFGGSGFVGRQLVARLAAAGHRVVVPTRLRALHKDMAVMQSVKVVEADIHDSGVLRQLLIDSDVAINLVGILNERGRDHGNGFTHAHVELTEKIVTACKQCGVPRLLHMSALKAHADDGPSHYLASKGKAESFIRAHCPPAVSYTIFQPSVIFGSGDGFINRFAELLRHLPLFPLAKPDARFQPVFVGDVAAAFFRSMDDKSCFGKTFTLCGPRTYALRDIVTYIADCMGLHRAVMGLPDGLASLQAQVFEWIPGKPFSIDNLRSLSIDNIADENGITQLGITPRSLESVVPTMLKDRGRNARYSILRKHAGR